MMSRPNRFTVTGRREARWAALGARRLPGTGLWMHAWLRDGGSLTRSVIACCEDRFRVDVVSQRRGRALPSEEGLLGSGSPQATLVREVKLFCGDEAWVFARTLIPMANLRGPVNVLTRLGRRPLGEVLFSDPTTRRLAVEVARITPRHSLYASASAHLRGLPPALWGRRTLFEYCGERLLVNEIFLPQIPELCR